MRRNISVQLTYEETSLLTSQVNKFRFTWTFVYTPENIGLGKAENVQCALDVISQNSSGQVLEESRLLYDRGGSIPEPQKGPHALYPVEVHIRYGRQTGHKPGGNES